MNSAVLFLLGFDAAVECSSDVGGWVAVMELVLVEILVMKLVVGVVMMTPAGWDMCLYLVMVLVVIELLVPSEPRN